MTSSGWIKAAFLTLATIGVVIISLTYILDRFYWQDQELNVILISIEALRPDHMSVYGYERDTTPNLQDFYANKSVFTHAYSPSPCTTPAVLQFLSGRFEHVNSTPIAEMLKKEGYSTAAVVSQHRFRTDKGPKKAYARGFEYFNVQGLEETSTHDFPTRSATVVTDIALDWIEAHDLDDPFFLWLHYFDPHDPHNPPDGFRDYVAPGKGQDFTGDVRTRLIDGLGDKEFHWQKNGEILSAEEIEYYNGLYDGEIRYVDHEIGKLLEYLDRRGLTEDSIIIVTSDHGERLGEFDTWDHCLSVHNMEVQVPFLVSVKGGKLPGVDVDSVIASTLDIYPTTLSLLGIDYNASELDGIELIKADSDRTVFSIWVQEKTLIKYPWKLHYYTENKSHSLINLDSDRMETEDKSMKEKHINRELLASMEKFIDEGHNYEKMYEQIKKHLQSIGYIP
ncbi:sulfatase [Candidatus Altiarchaeota archaeon]